MKRMLDILSPGSADYGYATSKSKPRQTYFMVWDDIGENVRAILKSSQDLNTNKLTEMNQLVPGNIAKSEFMSQEAWELYFLRRATERHNWTGRTENDLFNWEDVVKAVESPWERGLKIINDMIEKLSRIQLPTPRSIKRRPLWKSDEGEFDFDRFSNGEDCYRATAKRDLSGQQFVTIGVQTGANAGERPDRMMWRGAVAVALAKIVEDQGYSAEILAYDYGIGTLNGGRDLVNACWIKRPDQPLDISAITNAISPWYFRIVNFASYHLIPRISPSSGYGSEAVIPERLMKMITGDADYWRVDNCWNEYEAIRLAKKHLAKIIGNSASDLAQAGMTPEEIEEIYPTSSYR